MVPIADYNPQPTVPDIRALIDENMSLAAKTPREALSKVIHIPFLA